MIARTEWRTAAILALLIIILSPSWGGETPVNPNCLSSLLAGWGQNSLGCFSVNFCVLSVLRTADCKTEIHNIFISAYCPDSSVLRRCWHGRGVTPGNQHTVWDESVQSSSEAADGDDQFLRIVTVSTWFPVRWWWCPPVTLRPDPLPLPHHVLTSGFNIRWTPAVQWEILWFPGGE